MLHVFFYYTHKVICREVPFQDFVYLRVVCHEVFAGFHVVWLDAPARNMNAPYPISLTVHLVVVTYYRASPRSRIAERVFADDFKDTGKPVVNRVDFAYVVISPAIKRARSSVISSEAPLGMGDIMLS